MHPNSVFPLYQGIKLEAKISHVLVIFAIESISSAIELFITNVTPIQLRFGFWLIFECSTSLMYILLQCLAITCK